MRIAGNHRIGLARLELLLILSAIALLFQLFPAIGVWTFSLIRTVIAVVDFRYWSRPTWLIVNIVGLLVLVAIRFGPDLYDGWQDYERRWEAEQSQRDKRKAMARKKETSHRNKGRSSRRIY